MLNPTVCAVMLTCDRPELAARAVACFRRQTYERKRLLVYDTGLEYDCPASWGDVVYESCGGRTIGALRNAANGHSEDNIFLHWDDDDWSHPRRIEEQVRLLQTSGTECVGYREALFLRTPSTESWIYSVPNPSWVIGASLCYWAETWRKHPFPDLPKRNAAGEYGSSEDVVWRRNIACLGVSAIEDSSLTPDGWWREEHAIGEPRLICRIHGRNTMKYEIEKYPETWTRIPTWDEMARRMTAE